VRRWRLRRLITTLALAAVVGLGVGVTLGHTTTTTPAGAKHDYDRLAAFAQGASRNSLWLVVSPASLSAPGRGVVTPMRSATRIVVAAEEGSGILASDGTRISGFTGHGVDRVIGDGAKRAGVKPQALLDAIRNPTKITEGVDGLGRPYKIYTGSDARVVVNPQTGRVVSVNPLSRAGANR
jgi:hypothetical protein